VHVSGGSCTVADLCAAHLDARILILLCRPSDRFGGQIEACWESSSLRQYSSLDGGSLAALADDAGWSNEGLFAFLQNLRRRRQVGGDRVDVPVIGV
jgi:hypothetical protein